MLSNDNNTMPLLFYHPELDVIKIRKNCKKNLSLCVFWVYYVIFEKKILIKKCERDKWTNEIKWIKMTSVRHLNGHSGRRDADMTIGGVIFRHSQEDFPKRCQGKMAYTNFPFD